VKDAYPAIVSLLDELNFSPRVQIYITGYPVDIRVGIAWLNKCA
jgi:hypothetical protein